MGKKLAIQGHEQRGNVVINILKMLGGTNYNAAFGNNDETYYFINEEGIIDYDCTLDKDNDYLVFSLEEFLEKYPFKVGDKVMDVEGDGDLLTIKSMSWSDDCESMVYDFKDSVIVLAAEDLSKPRHHLKNVLSELYEHIKNTSKEELEKEFNELEEWSNVGPTVEEFMDFCNKVNKKPKYPTTYEECWKVRFEVDGETTLEEFHNVSGYYSEPLGALQKLLCCRDAYWKIYGEQMGLDKPWEPDWNDLDRKYFISLTCDGIGLYDDFRNPQILAFPTEEIRDVFYKNFKDLIEQCKELL